jgi:hypothetical protein
MPEYVITAHAKDMLKERGILEDWVLQTIQNPDQSRLGNDGNRLISDYWLSAKIMFYT